MSCVGFFKKFLSYHLLISHFSHSLTIKKQQQQQLNSDPISALLNEAPILDGHNDLPWVIRECKSNTIYDGNYDFKINLRENPQKWYENCSSMRYNDTSFVATDFPRLQMGGVGAQFWSIYVGCSSQYADAIRQTVEQADIVKRLTEANSDVMEFCGDADCVRNAWSKNKFASLMGMEGGHSIDSSMAMIRVFYNLGVRYMTLTHFCNTPWADYSEQTDVDLGLQGKDYIGGMTDFGKKVVQEMQRVGMLVDISHVSFETMLDALSVAKAPVIFSHSNARTVFDHSRNAPDEVLLKLKENQGIIMVNFVPQFTAEDWQNADYRNVADHLDYIKELIGVDHVGLGGDFDGVTATVKGLEDVSTYPVLLRELYENRNWSVEDLKKLTSGNILRVLDQSQKYARDQDRLDFQEDWISKQDISRISDVDVIEDSKFLPQCMTDLNLHPETDSDNFYPVEDQFNLQTLMKIPNSKYHPITNYRVDDGAVQVDGHDDLPWQLRKNIRNAIKTVDLRKNMREENNPEPWIPNHTDFARAKIGGLTTAFWVAYVDCKSNYKDAVRHTFEQIDVIRRMTEMYPEELEFATSADEIQSAVDQGRLASLIGIEGGHSMDSSLEILRAYADLGVRYMTLTHNCNTPWADQNGQDNKANEEYIGGMTKNFGKRVVYEMNRLGIFLDISHVSADVMRDALQWSLAPVIFSHSNSRVVHAVSRNAPDDVLQLLKNNGGVIMVVSLPGFVGSGEYVDHNSSGSISSLTVKDLANHIDHINHTIGHQYIGVGADFDGMGSALNDLQDVSEYPNLWAELSDRGYSNDQILDIRGRNLLRAMRGMEEVKERLAGQLPDETWIEKGMLEKSDDRVECRTDTKFHPDSNVMPVEPEMPDVPTSGNLCSASIFLVLSLFFILNN